MIYFDNAATTPLDHRVLAKMLPYLSETEGFGNPSSIHRYGQTAQAAIAGAKQQVADAIGLGSGEIIWTSGATEANNLAILGIASFYANRGKHIITTAQEHLSVLEPCEQLAKQGYRVTYLKPRHDGRIRLEDVKQALTKETLLITLAHANSETGVIQDIESIAQLANEHGVLCHIDAAQSAGKIALDFSQAQLTSMSLSAHKNYGPKGIGALVMRSQPKLRCQPLMFGGSQQKFLRPGTLPTAQIVGMGAAFALSQANLPAESRSIAKMRDNLLFELESFPNFKLNGSREYRLPNNINFYIAGIHGDALRYACDNIALSQGSACSAQRHAPSQVLQAMGVSETAARDSLRISLGRFTTPQDIQQAVKQLQHAIATLGALSPC